MARSDEDRENTVLGKREREVVDGSILLKNVSPSNGANNDEEDGSDSDVGPMPLPEVENGKAGRKKRKGLFIFNKYFSNCLLNNCNTVLPHERLFLEHLPSADRYSKSFMHRDTINFVCITKYVQLPYVSPKEAY